MKLRVCSLYLKTTLYTDLVVGTNIISVRPNLKVNEIQTRHNQIHVNLSNNTVTLHFTIYLRRKQQTRLKMTSLKRTTVQGISTKLNDRYYSRISIALQALLKILSSVNTTEIMHNVVYFRQINDVHCKEITYKLINTIGNHTRYVLCWMTDTSGIGLTLVLYTVSNYILVKRWRKTSLKGYTNLMFPVLVHFFPVQEMFTICQKGLHLKNKKFEAISKNILERKCLS